MNMSHKQLHQHHGWALCCAWERYVCRSCASCMRNDWRVQTVLRWMPGQLWHSSTAQSLETFSHGEITPPAKFTSTRFLYAILVRWPQMKASSLWTNRKNKTFWILLPGFSVIECYWTRMNWASRADESSADKQFMANFRIFCLYVFVSKNFCNGFVVDHDGRFGYDLWTLKRYLSSRRLDPWAENVVPTSLGCSSSASLDSGPADSYKHLGDVPFRYMICKTLEVYIIYHIHI